MVLTSMPFLFDKTKIQVLGHFILTPASVALKNSEKQKGRSQFTRHKLLILVLNLIPDVRTNTLSTAIQIYSSSGKFRDFYQHLELSSTPKTKIRTLRVQMIFKHGTQVIIFFKYTVMMVMISYVFYLR